MTTYDLVFAGGGAKGAVHSGALKELEKQGHSFGRLAGTSAGAITAMLLAAGYGADEVAAIFSEKLENGRNRLTTLLDTTHLEDMDMDAIRNSITFSDLKLHFLSEKHAEQVREGIMHDLLKQETYRQLFSFVEFGGFYSGMAFLSWMQEKLAGANGRFPPTITLAEFHQQTAVHLTLVATDTIVKDRLILNHITAPHLPVAWAVRMSMSIPLVWEEVLWRSEWGTYRGQNIDGHTIVDGGVVANLPLDLMLDNTPEIIDMMGSPSPNPAIGLRIDDSMEVLGTADAPPEKVPLKDRIEVDGRFSIVTTRLKNLVNTLTNAHDDIVAHLYPDNVCRLPAKGYDTMEFDMSDTRIELLINAGVEAMAAYLEQSDEE